MLTPRFYQVRAIDEVAQRFQAGKTRLLLSLATGLGKTVAFALLAKKLDTRTLILAHRDELLIQAADKIRLIWPGVDIGIVKADRDEVEAKVVVASVQSACRPNRLARLKERGFSLCVVDEAHHSTADSYKSVLQGLGFLEDDPSKLLLGVTATPYRADGTGLDEIFQEISFHMGIKEGIEQGFLSPLVGRQILSRVDLRGIGTSCGDFIASELSQAVNTPSRNKLIVESFIKHAESRKKALAFAVDIKHAQDLSESFRRSGIDSKAISGALNEKERRQILQEFASGKIRVLCNCALLVEGFDQPDIDAVLLCRPTQSEPFYVQMCGRATRLHPSKQNALILDFVDNASRHKLSSFVSLEGAVKVVPDEREEVEASEKEPPQEKSQTPIEYAGEREINFFEERQFAWTKIGSHWHLRLSSDSGVWVKQREEDGKYHAVAYQNGQETQISTQPLPLEYCCGCAEDYVRCQPKQYFARRDADWRGQPATQKQLDTLNKFGFQINGTVTKGQAAAMLDSKFSEPATPKQIAWLRGRGVDFPRAITKMQAKKLIAERLQT